MAPRERPLPLPPTGGTGESPLINYEHNEIHDPNERLKCDVHLINDLSKPRAATEYVFYAKEVQMEEIELVGNKVLRKVIILLEDDIEEFSNGTCKNIGVEQIKKMKKIERKMEDEERGKINPIADLKL